VDCLAVVFFFQTMAASESSWRRTPFTEGVPILYRANFDMEQFARLKKGHIPHGMDDKWFVYYAEPHLFFHRSWTGRPVYRLTLKTRPEGAEVLEALWSRDLAASSKKGPDYERHLLDFLVSNLILGEAKPFPLPPGLGPPTDGAFQHNVSGTGYPEAAPLKEPRPQAKPWWQFW